MNPSPPAPPVVETLAMPADAFMIPVSQTALMRMAIVVLGDIETASHLCSCDVCSGSSTLCPATASSLALAIGERLDDPAPLVFDLRAIAQAEGT